MRRDITPAALKDGQYRHSTWTIHHVLALQRNLSRTRRLARTSADDVLWVSLLKERLATPGFNPFCGHSISKRQVTLKHKLRLAHTTRGPCYLEYLVSSAKVWAVTCKWVGLDLYLLKHRHLARRGRRSFCNKYTSPTYSRQNRNRQVASSSVIRNRKQWVGWSVLSMSTAWLLLRYR